VGIGTITPAEILHVVGNIRNSVLAGSGNRAVYSDANGNLTNSSSDIRLKTNIETISDKLDVLATLGKLRGIYYNWNTSIAAAKDLGSQREIGMAAQEVQAVMPELVGVNSTGYLSLDYPKMTAFLVEVGKAQQNEIAGLQLALNDEGLLNATSTPAADFSDKHPGFVEVIRQVLAKLGIDIQNGIASITSLVTQNLKIGSAQKPSGFTLYDQATNQPFCVGIVNGDFVKTAGECGSVHAVAPAPVPVTTPAATVAPALPPSMISLTESPSESAATSSEPVAGSTATTAPVITEGPASSGASVVSGDTAPSEATATSSQVANSSPAQ
jgi:hypothetical protein